MITFPIIDTHLHLWDTTRLRYAWLDEIPALNRSFLSSDYRTACESVTVEQMVFLQCDCLPEQALQEVDFVMEAAASDPRITGIVAFAPLEQGEEVEAALEPLAANRSVRGVRRLLQGEPDPAFCLRSEFVRGVKQLARHNLHFEICIQHTQLASVIQLVRQCPEVRFILDHIGKPDIRQQILQPWMEEIEALAQMPNVWCKLSGMVTEADHISWRPEDLKPYADHIISCFGFDRVMYGSDWPVCTLAGDIPRWVEALEWLIDGCSPKEKQQLFHDNAMAFYRLS